MTGSRPLAVETLIHQQVSMKDFDVNGNTNAHCRGVSPRRTRVSLFTAPWIMAHQAAEQSAVGLLTDGVLWEEVSIRWKATLESWWDFP